MITFARAKRVGVGDPFTSSTWNSFVAAANERVLSGLGDAAWRIVQFLLGAVRSATVGTLDGKTRAEGEFFTFQQLYPNVANWPTGGVDPVSGLPEPNGPNVANPLMAFVYGNKANGIDPESQRMNALPTVFAEDTDEAKWVAAKYWRGLKDPSSGLTASPARDVAHEVMRFAYGKAGQFGTSFGGFLPGPKPLSPECTPPCNLTSSSCNIFPRENLEVYFTAVREGVSTAGLHFDSTATVDGKVRGYYAGTCIPCIYPPDCPSGNYGTHIDRYVQTPEGFFIHLNDGTMDFLPIADWIEGPYTVVSALSRDIGDQIPRAVWAFAKEFRGTVAQRGGTWNLDYAFDNQSVWTSQYALAPARGVVVGDSITGTYPTYGLGPGTYAAGQALDCGRGGTSYSWLDGYVATHVFVVLRGTSAVVPIRVTHADGSFVVSATTTGTIYPLATVGSLRDVQVKLVNDTVLAGDQELLVEFTELEPYKPNWWDIAVLLRKGAGRLVGATGGELADAFVDGQGVDEEGSLTLSDEYIRTGIVPNIHETTNLSDPTAVNENAVFEAFRRMSQDVRIMNRFHLLDYEVDANGDSILYFTPHPRTDGASMANPTDDGDPDIDVFDGFGVWKAGPDSFSSRWCMFVDFKAMVDDGGSIWRPDTFADQYVDVSRCMFDDYAVTADQDFMGFINRSVRSHGIGAWYASAPSGWNHAQLFATRNFINHKPGASDDRRIAQEKSCPIYKRPVEVRAVERFVEADRDIVKVTFKGRLQNTHGETLGAPATVPRHGWVSNPGDAGPWDHATIAAEPWRSDENAIRLYLFWRWKAEAPPLMSSDVPGDRAITSPSGVIAEGMTGSVLPTVHFVHLLPEAYVDANDEIDEGVDSPLMHDMTFQAEWYLRAMVEGAVAGAGTLDCSNPDSARMYDWPWSNLCAYLFNAPWISAFPTAGTTDADGQEMIPTSQARPDGPQGFGALPNTLASSAVFNRLVDTVNSIDRFRLMLPWLAEERHTDVGVVTIDAGGTGNHGCGNGSDCSSVGSSGAKISTNLAPADVGGGVWGSWTDITFPSPTSYAFTGHGITACLGSDPTHWGLFSNRQIVEFRFTIVDWSIYQFACDPAWRDMVAGASEYVGALFAVTQTKTWNEVATGDYTCSGEALPSFDCNFIERQVTDTWCEFMRNGITTLDCGATPIGGWAWMKQTLASTCSGGSLNQLHARMISDTMPVLFVPLEDRAEGVDAPWIVP